VLGVTHGDHFIDKRHFNAIVAVGTAAGALVPHGGCQIDFVALVGTRALDIHNGSSASWAMSWADSFSPKAAALTRWKMVRQTCRWSVCSRKSPPVALSA